MRICIVGPGIMEIPPRGWGAVEIIIWDYYNTLSSLGHEVKIINYPNKNNIIDAVNSANPDFVHIQYDEHIDIISEIKCKNIAITSHYAYIVQPNKFIPKFGFIKNLFKYDQGYNKIFNEFITKDVNIIALSENIKEIYVKYGKDPRKIHVVPNAVKSELFRISKVPKYEDRSIYLAKIEDRKKQYKYQSLSSVYFAGNICDSRFKSPNYLGELEKDALYNTLTDYANLILLSDGEAHPLVCLEAMSAGLGLVINKWSIANLDISLHFIEVIEDEKLNDIEYINNVIKRNRIVSIKYRKKICEYVVNNFDYVNIIKNTYLPALKKIMELNRE